MIEIQDRVKMLIEALNESQNGFAKKIGVQSTVINHIVTGNSHNEGKRNKPSFDLLTKIISAYPRVSLDWLISGEGDIYKPTKNMNDFSESNISLSKLIQEIKQFKDIILEKDRKEMIYIETISNLSKH